MGTVKKDTDSFRGMKFVGAEGEGGDAGGNGEGLLAYVGDGIEEEGDVVFFGDGGEGGEIDFNAGFVIAGGKDDGCGGGANRRCKIGRERRSGKADGEIGDVAGGKSAVNGRVFDRGGDEGAAKGAKEVIEAFGAARGEKNFFRCGIQKRGNRAAGVGKEVAGLLAKPVDARGIRWRTVQVQEHRPENSRIERGRRIVV